MKSFFTKLGGLLLCGVMFIAVGCHDYAEDIQQTNDRIDAIDKVLDGSSDGVAKDLAALKAELATLKAEVAANTALTASIEGIVADLAEVEATLAGLQTTLADKADTKDLTAAVEKLEGAMATAAANVESALTDLDEKFAKSLSDAVAELNGKIAGLSTEIDGLEGDVQNLETNLGALQGSVTELQTKVTGLTTELTTLKENVAKNTSDIQKLQKDLADEVAKIEEALAAKADKTQVEGALAELNAAVEKKASADSLAAAVAKLDAAIAGVEETVAGDIAEAIAKVKEEFALEIEEVRGEMDKALENCTSEITKVMGRVEVTEAQIKQLFNRIQSVVFRPEFSDNTEHVVYSTAGEQGQVNLQGYNYVTYKVYPAACAETIADAINATEEKLLDVTFDAIQVKSAGEDVLNVVSAEADEDGCLTICYKANLSDDFYQGTKKYSAALVLKEAREDNPQNFSTQYTNFVPEAAAKNWTIQAYVADAAYDATAEYANVEIPFVAYDRKDKRFQTEILAGVAPRFVSGTEVLTAEEFAALGYDSEYTLVTTSAYPTEETEQAIAVSIDGTSSVALACLAKLGVDNIGASAEVTKTLTWALTEESVAAKADIEVIDLPYELVVKAVSRSHNIPYTDKETSLSAEVSKLEVYFENVEDDTDVLTPAEMKELYPSVEVTSTAALSKDVALFEVTGESYPVSVKLAEKVVAEDVTKKVRVRYAFDVPVLEREPIAAAYADVIIDPQTYHFYTLPVEYFWNYNDHATVDAARFNQITEQYIAKDKFTFNGSVVVDDVKLAEHLTKLSYEVKIGDDVVESDTYDIFVGPTLLAQQNPANLKDAKMTFKGIEWGKEYTIVGRSEIPTGKFTTDENGNEISIPGAVIYVHFDLKTVDRNREPAKFVADPINVEYALSTDGAVKEDVSFASIYNTLVESKNINDTKKASEGYLNDAEIVSDVVKWAETSVDNKGADWSLVADFATATYDVNYTADNDFLHVDDVVAKEFTYEKTFTTWYGQEITLVQPIKLVDPKYDFSPVYQYYDYDEVNECFYTTVQPFYNPSPADFTSFSVNDVKLNNVFDVVAVNGENTTKLSDTELATLGLNRVFTLDKVYTGIEINDNVLSYNGTDDYVVVNGALYIETTTGQKYTIDETIFTNDFENYQVRKFDPIADMVILEGKENQTISINQNKVYTFNVLNNYSLKDVLGNEIIGATKNYAAIYDVEFEYTIKFITPETAPTGVTPDSTNGTITIDNTSQVVFEKPVVVEVTATAKYPQAVKVGKTVTYTFTK